MSSIYDKLHPHRRSNDRSSLRSLRLTLYVLEYHPILFPTEVTISPSGIPNANATVKETISNDMNAFNLKPVIKTINRITPIATINNGISLSPLIVVSIRAAHPLFALFRFENYIFSYNIKFSVNPNYKLYTEGNLIEYILYKHVFTKKNFGDKGTATHQIID